MKDKLKIVVLGYIVRGPLGGLVWHHFQYVYGLHLSGHEVLFMEDSENYPACYNPETFRLSANPDYGLQFISTMFKNYNLENQWTYYDFHTNRWFGKPENETRTFLKDADILLNLSGINPIRSYLENIPQRVFIDTDPVFTQVKHLTDTHARHRAQQHNRFFTFGEHFGKPGCTIPADGFNWQPTRQPIVPTLWNHNFPAHNNTWTTVMQWDSYKTLQWEGKTFGMKSKSFDEYMLLPQKLNEHFELALGSENAPYGKLKSLGWKISDPLQITKTPQTYQRYIAGSKGEWSIAKHGYVHTHSGWFSERSAAYLASAKPVVVQNTGFSTIFKTGRGLFAFDTINDLPVIFDEINRLYPQHCRWAKELCLEYFDYRKVLEGLLTK